MFRTKRKPDFSLSGQRVVIDLGADRLLRWQYVQFMPGRVAVGPDHQGPKANTGGCGAR